MGKAERRKGHDFERELARILKEETGLPFKRGFQTRAGGGEQADVLCEGLPYHFECKVGKRPPFKRALEQAERDCSEEAIPLAVVKVDREEPIVLMRMKDFLPMFSTYLDWGKGT